MEQTAVGSLVYCSVTRMSKFRRDPQGRGVWHYCRGHKREELDTWEELGLTRAVCERLLATMREP